MTDKPRKNIYLNPMLDEFIRDYAHLNRISQSEACRRAIENFCTIAQSPEYQAAQRLAEEKSVDTSEVVTQALKKVIPERFYRE